MSKKSKLSSGSQVVLGLVFLGVFLLGRHAYQGQIEWLSRPNDEEIRAVIAETSSVKAYETLLRLFPDEARNVRGEIKRHIKLQRRGIVSNITARNLLVDVRRRHGALAAQAPDELIRAVLSYHARWLNAVSDDPEMCERVLAIGDAGVLHARLREFADDDLMDNSILFEAMEAGRSRPVNRVPPDDREWLAFHGDLLGSGLSPSDLTFLDPNRNPGEASCGAVERYLMKVSEANSPLAERARASIAKGLLELRGRPAR